MTAAVRSDSYLTLHYRITTLDGEEFLSTFDMSPATLQMGSSQLAENLESVLIGLPAHERFVFQLEPEEAFGQTNPRLVERILVGHGLVAVVDHGAEFFIELVGGFHAATSTAIMTLSLMA